MSGDGHPKDSRDTLLNVQYLRFIAAALVVMHHCYKLVPKHGMGDVGSSFAIGAAGVDIFFAISGFIMYVITDRWLRSPIEFVALRLTRVAPMYWLATALMAIMLVVAPSIFVSSKISIQAFVASILFIPWPHATLDGAVPILQIGWTLNYEFMFYVIFAVALAISVKWRILIATSVIALLIVVGLVVEPTGVRFQFLTSTILLEFIFGMLIGWLYVDRRLPSGRISLFILVGGFATLALVSIFPVDRLSQLRPIIWGVPSAFILLGAVGAEVGVGSRKSPTLLALGNASYSIYLTHLFTLGVVGYLWGRLSLGSTVTDALLLGSGMVSSIVIGYFVYRLVELPLLGLARRWSGELLTRAGLAKVAMRPS